MTRTLRLGILLTLLAGTVYTAGQQPTAVYTFSCNGKQLLREGSCPEGGRPDSLIQGADGKFYGSAQVSMEGSSTPTGGSVFSLTSTGKFTLLHTFNAGTNQSYANGNLPGWLVEGPDGRLYGETEFGGVDGCNGYCGYGVLYRVNTDGTGFRILNKFCSDPTCGAIRETATKPLTGADGNLYGTLDGGTSAYGSIYRITPSTGAFETVFNFNFSTNEGYASALTLGPGGIFYAMALGSSPALVLTYDPTTGASATTQVIFPLFENLLPSSPSSGLTFGPNGNLYGLYQVYAENGVGLFEVAPDGSNLQLFPFVSAIAGGGTPDGLLLASDGNFWMADYTGNSGYGNIIKISPTDGTLIQTLSPFGSSANVGAYPTGIIEAKDGSLWGTTSQYGKAASGHFADGTVFRVNAGLPPR